MADPSIPLILLGFFSISFLTLKTKTYEAMSIDATEQIRGLAIIAIIMSHYITRLFVPGLTKYYWVFKDAGGIGVGVFLLLSGFGIMSSFKKTETFSRDYIFKRFMRILFPYWFFVILWIILDALLLNLHHTWKQILEAFGGIVILGDYTKDINPAMWFVTFILILSLLFYGVFSLKIKRSIQLILLFLFSSFAILISRYIAAKYNLIGLIQWGDYSLFFPVGVLLAEYYQNIRTLFLNLAKKESFMVYILLSICILIFGQYWSVLLIFLLFIPIWYLSSQNLFSGFLLFLGGLSYELYLVHIPFLLKYDFILFRKPYIFSFGIFFILMTFIAYCTNRLITGRLLKQVFGMLHIST